MANASYGYQNDIVWNGIQWAGMQQILGRDYFCGLTAAKVSPIIGGVRQAQVSAGDFGGRGIYDVFDTPVPMASFAAPAPATTDYHMVVARRTWGATFLTTFASIAAGTGTIPPTNLPTRNTLPGVLDDQPLALVSITAGDAEPVIVADLRCITAADFSVIFDDRALQYLAGSVGRTVYNAVTKVTWRRILTSAGAAAWSDAPVHTGGVVLAKVFPFGTGAAGEWSCVDQDGDDGTFAVRDNNDREIVWRIRNKSDTVIFNASGNPTQGDVIIANAGNVAFRPDEDRKGFSGKCWTTNGSTYGVDLDFLKNGDLVLISGPPGQTLRQSLSLYAIEATVAFKKRTPS